MERTVIDEDVILASIREQRALAAEVEEQQKKNGLQVGQPEKPQTTEDDDEPIVLSKIEQLALSFRDIYVIDHLRGFERLTKLQLDNNVISKIENIDHLVNLRWLDLSFNNITKIEGLEKLVNLESLSLMNNLIEELGGLDENKSLQILSLGNNKLSDVKRLLYLRTFAKLGSLCLKGNPLHEDPEFRNTVLAFLPQVKFLDYERIKADQVALAREEKQGDLMALEEEELGAREAREKADKRAAREDLHTRANIAGVATLVEDMLATDTEMRRLRFIPGFDEIVETIREGSVDDTARYVKDVVKVYQEKVSELDSFRKTMAAICADHEQGSIDRIREYRKEATRLATSKSIDVMALETKLKDACGSLSEALMEVEMHMVEHAHHVIDTFDSRWGKLMEQNFAAGETYFKLLSERENAYYERLEELQEAILTRISDADDGAEEVVEQLSSDEGTRTEMNAFFKEVDIVKNACTTSHDNHLTLIGKLEDGVRDREEKEKKDLVDEASQAEYRRNRSRVSEVYDIIRKFTKENEEVIAARREN